MNCFAMEHLLFNFILYLFLDSFNVVGENNKTNKWYKTSLCLNFGKGMLQL